MELEYKSVVKNLATGAVGIVVSECVRYKNDYINVRNVRQRGGVIKPNSSWLKQHVVPCPEVSPEELGVCKNDRKAFEPFYARNTNTGGVGIVMGMAAVNGQAGYWLKLPNGTVSTWQAKSTEEITQEEYDALEDKFVGKNWSHKPKHAGEDRICRKDRGGCGKSTRGNYWLCPACHAKLIKNQSGVD